MRIPKKINQVLIVDGMELPPSLPKGFSAAMDSFKIMNPDYKYKLYSGNECREWIKTNYIYTLFEYWMIGNSTHKCTLHTVSVCRRF